MGLSYSEVDMPYIREICERIKKSGNMEKCVWHFEEFDSVERCNEFKKKITKVGYNGSYAGFKM